MEFIDLKQQYSHYKEEIDLAWKNVMEHGRFIMGPEVKKLEEKLEEFTTAEHAIAVANGTDALQLSLMALDIGPGDEVITTSFTWLSTAEVIKLLGATPVLVDIDPDTYLINIEQMKAAITPKTKAIIPVSLFGQMSPISDFDGISIPIIEDAAQSLGARHQGRPSCSWATISTTSFFPAKPLGCYGDGGAVFTNDKKLAEKVSSLRVHGGNRQAGFHYPYVGVNSRLDTLQAAILLAKLPHFQNEIQKRIEIGAYYSAHLSSELKAPKIIEGNTHLYAQYVVRSPMRARIQEALKEKGIPSAIYYPKAIHQQPAYEDAIWTNLSESERACSEVFALPMHPFLKKEEQDLVIKTVNEAIRNELALV